MAKQSINMFKEEGKVIIEITEPSKETLKKLDEMFGNTIIDLANLLVPIDETKKNEAEIKEIEEKIEAVTEPEATKTEEPVKQEEVSVEEKKPAEKKPVDVTQMTVDQAKSWLTAFIEHIQKDPAMKFNAYRVLCAYAVGRNRKDLIPGLEGKDEDSLHALINDKNILKGIAKLVGMELSSDAGWV